MLKVINFKNTSNDYQSSRNVSDLISGKNTWTFSFNDPGILISDSLKELVDFASQSYQFAPISANDKIFFSKSSNYPSLLLSKIKSTYPNLNITRVIKPDTADKIVVGKDAFKNRLASNNYCYKRVYLINADAYNYPNTSIIRAIPYSSVTDKQMLANAKASLEKGFSEKFYYATEITYPDTIELALNNSAKITNDTAIIKYTYSFLPKITDADIDSIKVYLKSNDEEARKLGIECFQYYNLGDKLFQIFQLLAELSNYSKNLLPNFSASLASWKLLYITLNTSGEEINNTVLSTNLAYYIKKVMDNPLDTNSGIDLRKLLKEAVIHRINNSVEFGDFRKDLKLINCSITIIDDKDRETTTSD